MSVVTNDESIGRFDDLSSGIGAKRVDGAAVLRREASI